MAKIFSLLLIVSGICGAEGLATLKRIEWARDEKTPTLVYIRFIFDAAPPEYPAFSLDDPPSIHIDFSNSRLDPGTHFLQKVPPPLSSLKVVEKALKDGSPITQVDLTIEKKLPFFTKREGNQIVLGLDVQAAFLRQKVLLKSDSTAAGNSIMHLSVQSTQEFVEVLVAFSHAPQAFPTYILDDPPRVVMDLPGVIIDAEKEETVDIPPVTSVKLVKGEELSTLIFNLKKVNTFQTVQKGNQVSLLLPWKPDRLSARRRWIYLSAGVLLLSGGVTAVLMGGDEKTGQPPSTSNGGGGDDWDDPPPDPDDVLK